MRGRHYTDSEIAYIAARYAVTTTHVIALELGRTVHGIRQVIQRNRIKRRAKDKSRIYSGWSRQPGAKRLTPDSPGFAKDLP